MCVEENWGLANMRGEEAASVCSTGAGLSELKEKGEGAART